jgi:hypothetical protein
MSSIASPRLQVIVRSVRDSRPGFLSTDQLAQICVDGWNVLEVAHLAVVLQLGDIVCTEFVHLLECLGMPIGIKVNQRGESTRFQPARLDCTVRSL